MNKIIQKEFKEALSKIGISEYSMRYREVFGIPVLDYVDSIVLNLPSSCHANCPYCIDKYLMKNSIGEKEYLDICSRTFEQFPELKRITITGGSMSPSNFNLLIENIKNKYGEIELTWNTNGILIDNSYDISSLTRVNLHRNSENDKLNEKKFFTSRHVMTIKEAMETFGEKLCLRVTVESDFDIDDYIKYEIPMYLNRLLPGNDKSDAAYYQTLKKLSVIDESDVRRRNKYIVATYKNVPVRICVGDKLSTHVSGRYPTFLNVCIIHRTGRVCGSWYEDDKVLFIP